jgi:hypothetical protein
LPVQHDAFQKVGPAQEWAVGRSGTAEHHVVAAASAGVAAVEHELVGAEAGLASVLVEPLGDRDRTAPAFRRVDVDLDDTWVWRDLDDIHAMVGRRPITFHMNRDFQVRRGRLDRGEQLQIIFKLLDRRHEHAQAPIARLDGERGAHRYIRRSAIALFALFRLRGFLRRHPFVRVRFGEVIVGALEQDIRMRKLAARHEGIGRHDDGLLGGWQTG